MVGCRWAGNGGHRLWVEHVDYRRDVGYGWGIMLWMEHVGCGWGKQAVGG